MCSYLDLYKAVKGEKLTFREHFKSLFFPPPPYLLKYRVLRRRHTSPHIPLSERAKRNGAVSTPKVNIVSLFGDSCTRCSNTIDKIKKRTIIHRLINVHNTYAKPVTWLYQTHVSCTAEPGQRSRAGNGLENRGIVIRFTEQETDLSIL